MKPSRPPENLLAGFPWSTYGRRETNDELQAKLREQRGRVELLPHQPKISLVIPVDRDVPVRQLEMAVAALTASSYPRWQARFVVSSSRRTVENGLRALEGKEPRLGVTVLEADADPTALRGAGVADVDGEWLGFLEPDAVLSPAALYLAMASLESRGIQVVYWNAARIDGEGRKLLERVTRPAFSRFTLLFHPYFGSDGLLKRQLYDDIVGESLRVGEQELWLRASERSCGFVLVPATLSYRRTSLAPPAATADSVEVVRQHLERRGVTAEVSLTGDGEKTRLRIVPRSGKRPTVTVIIPFRDRSDWTIRSARSVAARIGAADADVILVDNRSSREQRDKVERAARSLSVPAKVVPYDGEFNFAEIHNRVVRDEARGEILCLLNNDVFWSRGTLAEVAAWAERDDVGTVGFPLRYEKGSLQHGGIRGTALGGARLVRIGPRREDDAVTGLTREVFANTFAACVFRRKLFEEVGGLRAQDLANGFGDVAFSLECLKRGYRNLFLTFVEGIHLESATRGAGYEYWEERVLERDYPELLQRMAREDWDFVRPRGARELATTVGGALLENLRERAPWWDWARPRLQTALETVARARQRFTEGESGK